MREGLALPPTPYPHPLLPATLTVREWPFPQIKILKKNKKKQINKLSMEVF